MKITCPHCHRHVEVVGQEPETYTRCPACGSDLSLELRTSTYHPRPAKLLHGFELLECVGVGQFGEVWKAKDRKLNRFVAVKLPRTHLLDHEAFNTFVREAQAAAQLRHPNIVTVFDVLREGDRIFMVSEYIEGVSLAEYGQEHRWSYREAAELTATVADALQHAHDAGVIHRDLKPSNIMLDGKRVPHITDFGLAKREGDEITLSIEGKVLGTPAYMSPEQAGGRGHDADGRSDVYSLGVILYEMLLGKRPFGGKSRMLIHQILYEEPPGLRRQDRQIPRDLETICLKALSKAPADRYATMADFAGDLLCFLRGEPIVARPAGPVERAWRWCRRNPAWTVASACAAIMFVAVAVVIGKEYGLREEAQRRGAAEKRNREIQQQLAAARDKLPAPLPPQRVLIKTDPPGADLEFFPLSVLDGRMELENQLQFPGQAENHVAVPPGNYLVVAHLPNGEFHEVFRRVPHGPRDFPGRYPHYFFLFEQDEAVLPDIKITPAAEALRDMVLIRGTTRVDVVWQGTQRTARVPDFYLDPTEVSVAKFRQVYPTSDSLGRSRLPDGFPMTDLSFDEAIVYAEQCGKIPPTDLMFYYASTAGKSRFPWGDNSPPQLTWTLGDVAEPTFDTRQGEPRLRGLFSNALEWTIGPFPAFGVKRQTMTYDLKSTTVCGGPESALKSPPKPADWAPGSSVSFEYLIVDSHPLVGFRCARSVHPRVTAADFAQFLPEDSVAASP